jgi:O-antigen/teichoic acid export membrane protein
MKFTVKNCLPDIVRDYFTTGHNRSIKAKKNIIASFGLKGFSILVSFLLVPLTLNYLNATKYGLWLTISSIIGWFGFFDIGLGNGLRNKLAEAFALKDYKLAKTYVSTTYAIISLVIGGVFLLFLFINPFLDWSKLLNTRLEMAGELSRVAMVVFTFFALRFVFNLIGIILTSDQLPAVNNSFGPLGNLIAFVAIYLITKFTHGNLLYISLIYSAAPVLILIIASFYFFNGKYEFIKPDLKAVDFKYFKSLADLGVKFFVLQIACLIIFSTDNVIITQILGPAEVTPYNIAFKYFGIAIMIFTIVLTPFWSAYTEAFTNGDMKWIKASIKRLIMIWLAVVMGVVFLIGISKYFYLMWVGDKVHVPFLLSVFMGLFVIISTWNNIFAYFINGAGKIKLQMYYGIVAMIINIPVSIFFAKNLGMGSAGVILGTCVSLIIGSFLAPIQYLKIINGNAKGIWNK